MHDLATAGEASGPGTPPPPSPSGLAAPPGSPASLPASHQSAQRSLGRVPQALLPVPSAATSVTPAVAAVSSAGAASSPGVISGIVYPPLAGATVVDAAPVGRAASRFLGRLVFVRRHAPLVRGLDSGLLYRIARFSLSIG